MEKNQPKNANKHLSKQNLQSISICNYYLKFLFPSIFKTHPYPPHDFAKIRAIDRNIAYNYSHQVITGIQDFCEQTIFQAAKNVYLSNQCSKIKQNCFLKTTVIKLPYIPIWKQISEEIDIFVLKQDQKREYNQKNAYRSPNKVQSSNTIQRKGSHQLISINRNEETAQEKQSYSLYIIHNNQNLSDSNIHWENFIEKYTFTAKQNDEAFSSIIYQTIFTYYVETALLKLNQTDKFLQLFYQTSVFHQKNHNKCLMTQKYASKLRSLIQINKIKTNLELQSSSFDASHRRELKLTAQQKIIFNNLKIKAFAHFGAINRKREINRYFLENLICRMMINQNYKQSQSWDAIKYYIEFQKKMRDKYRWSSFQKYDKMNIFTYIGKDIMGRPILLNRLRNNLCSKIQNFDEFFDYHMYLFEIYMQDQMEGWVDQFVVIADVSNQVADNTNLGFTKRILMEGYKVTLGRPFKIVAFDISFIGTALYRVLKPLLPNSLIDCVRVIGDDRGQLLEELRNYISDESIPEFLGGKNQTIETRAMSEQKVNTEVTTDRSMLRSVKSMKNL